MPRESRVDNRWTPIPSVVWIMEGHLMGAELVGQVLAHWTHVSDRAFRVLVRMALTALDKPNKGRPAAVYHGGRELLAMSLRSEKGTNETRYRAVKRALSELAEAGAIQHLQAGWSGQNSVYRITVERRSMGGPTSPPVGGPTSPPKGGPLGPEKGGPTSPPKEPRGTNRGAREEQVVDLQTPSHPPHATETDQENVIPFPSSKTDRQARQRDAGKAELAAKAAQARDGLAAIDARRRARRETS